MLPNQCSHCHKREQRLKGLCSECFRLLLIEPQKREALRAENIAKTCRDMVKTLELQLRDATAVDPMRKEPVAAVGMTVSAKCPCGKSWYGPSAKYYARFHAQGCPQALAKAPRERVSTTAPASAPRRSVLSVLNEAEEI